MNDAIEILKLLVTDGILSDYALGGGIAATFYMEPVLTYDLDVFVLVPESDNPLISLSPLYEWLQLKGIAAQGEHVIVSGLPVQFIPAYNKLVEESVQEAIALPFAKTSVRVVRPEHLAAIMLQTGRPKDLARLALFVENVNLDITRLSDLLRDHDLSEKWQSLAKQEQ